VRAVRRLQQSLLAVALLLKGGTTEGSPNPASKEAGYNTIGFWQAFQSCVLFSENASAETRQNTASALVFRGNNVRDRDGAHQLNGCDIGLLRKHLPGHRYRLA